VDPWEEGTGAWGGRFEVERRALPGGDPAFPSRRLICALLEVFAGPDPG
jgi:hypothetical protein